MHTQEYSASCPPHSHSIPLPLLLIMINDTLPTGPPFPEAPPLHSQPVTNESMTLGNNFGIETPSSNHISHPTTNESTTLGNNFVIEAPSSNHSPQPPTLVHDTDMFCKLLASVEQLFTPDISLPPKLLTNDPFTEGSPHQWDVLMSPKSELCSPKTGKPGDGEYIVSHSLFGLMCGWRISAWSHHPQQMNTVTVHFNKQDRLPPLTLSATVVQLNNREDLHIMVVNSLIGKYNAIWEGKMLPPTPPRVWRLAYKLQPVSPPSPPSPMPHAASYPPSSLVVGPLRHPPFPDDRLGSSPVPDTSPSPLECQTSHCAVSYSPLSLVAGPSRPLPFSGDSIGSSPVPDTSPSPPECQTSQCEADKKVICRRDVCHLFDNNIDVIEDHSVGAHLGAHGLLSPVREVDGVDEEDLLVGVEVDEEEEEDSLVGVEEDEKQSKELPVVEEEEEYEEEKWSGIAPDEPVQQSVDSPPAERHLSSTKGKEHAIETVADDEGEDDADTLNVKALKTDYCWHIKALAKRMGKFQHFMVAEDGMDWKQQPGQSPEKFQASIQQVDKEVLNLPEKKKDYYVVQLNEWYVKKMHDHTSEEQVEGYSETHLAKLCSKFLGCATLMYDTHGLSFFGWVVDPVTAKAVQWGRDELFKGMRNANASTLKVQSVDYVRVKHQLEAWKKGVSGEGKGKGKGSNSDDEDDEDEGGELVCFIPWDEEQRALSIKDQAHILIV
ncbi:hypothetical protein GYMLUDRAFT_250209 [Collybiopsis luxurians FD-317 M1]|uniref:Uncharacterized protein n=1 Tax=Collybiopsis luxurians FD-317 M1 TaxID=944289 RepID=A0A0D0BG24_9AGAR|nr:hypothetical protein GYMLUDRAFT_250209 [Collybiopsis luxurians FD-317 M1]